MLKKALETFCCDFKQYYLLIYKFKSCKKTTTYSSFSKFKDLIIERWKNHLL